MGSNQARGSYQSVPQNEQALVTREQQGSMLHDDEDYERSANLTPRGASPKERLLLRKRISALEPGDIPRSKKGGTFENDGLEDYFVPTTGYEGSHRFDPEFHWEPLEEKRLVRKLDWRICAWVCITFSALMLDRGNIIHALSGNMLDDIGLNTNDYDVGLALFSLFFLLAELPSQLISKWVGAELWIPVQIVSWSVVAACQAFLTGRTSFYVCRALIGLLEGGFIPNNILYLSYYYTSEELPIRLAFFWGSYNVTSILSAFLTYAIFHLDGIGGIQGWRWLFFLEGLLSAIVGVITFFYLPPSPTQTKGGLRGKDGWFTEREEKIMVNRVLRDDPSKGDMRNRQPITKTMLWACLTDYDMWPIYLLGLLWMIPSYPMTQYLTLQLKTTSGFSTLAANLLSIPAYLIFLANIAFWTWLSERLNERLLLSAVSQLWCVPLLLALQLLPAERAWARYAVTVLLVGFPFVQAILVAIASRNAGSVRTRAVAAALYNMCVQTSNILGASVYQDSDKPYYYRGNRVLIVIALVNTLLFAAAKVYYVRKNRMRERVWSAMTREEKEKYLETTTDQGNRRLDFRFAH